MPGNTVTCRSSFLRSSRSTDDVKGIKILKDHTFLEHDCKTVERRMQDRPKQCKNAASGTAGLANKLLRNCNGSSMRSTPSPAPAFRKRLSSPSDSRSAESWFGRL